MGATPRSFRVLWGDPFRGVVQEVVEAHDADEALTLAAQRRPDLPRPRTAYLASPSAP
ncbi:MAG: hypothetical protein KGJ36_03165 [Acidobacteriota bacterium]|nr:hypothetical protein [Acidobacteriota bacterium]